MCNLKFPLKENNNNKSFLRQKQTNMASLTVDSTDCSNTAVTEKITFICIWHNLSLSCASSNECLFGDACWNKTLHGVSLHGCISVAEHRKVWQKKKEQHPPLALAERRWCGPGARGLHQKTGWIQTNNNTQPMNEWPAAGEADKTEQL